MREETLLEAAIVRGPHHAVFAFLETRTAMLYASRTTRAKLSGALLDVWVWTADSARPIHLCRWYRGEKLPYNTPVALRVRSDYRASKVPRPVTMADVEKTARDIQMLREREDAEAEAQRLKELQRRERRKQKRDERRQAAKASGDGRGTEA